MRTQGKTTKEVAGLLGVNPSTIHRLVIGGVLRPSVRDVRRGGLGGSGSRLFSDSDIELLKVVQRFTAHGVSGKKLKRAMTKLDQIIRRRFALQVIHQGRCRGVTVKMCAGCGDLYVTVPCGTNISLTSEDVRPAEYVSVGSQTPATLHARESASAGRSVAAHV